MWELGIDSVGERMNVEEMGLVPWEGDIGIVLDYFIELSLKYFMTKALGRKR